MNDPGPFRPPTGMNEMPREMLIDVIHQLIASLNQLRALIIANSSAPRTTSDPPEKR